MRMSIPEVLRRQLVSPEFWEMMKNRMVVGFYRHGALDKREQHNALRYLEGKLKSYKETGNTEILVDIANCAMLEFSKPEHPNAHFRSEDQGSRVTASRTAAFR